MDLRLLFLDDVPLRPRPDDRLHLDAVLLGFVLPTGAGHFDDLGDDVIQVGPAGREGLALAGEVLKSFGRPGAAQGGLFDDLEVTPALRIPRLRFRQLRDAEDDGQGVVEIVRHAGGQPSQGLDLLALADLFFQPPLFGDVFGDSGNPVDLSVLVPDGKRAVPYPAQGAVGTDDPELLVVSAEGQQRQGFQDALPVLRVDGFFQDAGIVVVDLGLEAPDFLERRADIDWGAVGLGEPKISRMFSAN